MCFFAGNQPFVATASGGFRRQVYSYEGIAIDKGSLEIDFCVLEYLLGGLLWSKQIMVHYSFAFFCNLLIKKKQLIF